MAVAVGAAGDDLAADGAAHLGHLLGPLVDEQHDEVHLGMVLRHGLGDVLQQDGLAGARRGDDQAALPLADGREQVHDARGQRLLAGLQADLLARVDGREIVELARAVLLGRLSLDGLDAGQARPRPLAGGVHGAGQQQAFAEAEFLDEGGRHVGVGGLGDVVAGGVAQKSVALGVQFQHALGRLVVASHRVLREAVSDQLSAREKTDSFVQADAGCGCPQWAGRTTVALFG